ncbi:hypothetical protein ACJMK2_039301 [Sinanodonta woodiana]|uniref:EF-hand domain-containing protein n=1 Tax=Sinanodonta woodiana TaxID=1069815 RepID=A0ABD3WBK2_SINWO
MFPMLLALCSLCLMRLGRTQIYTTVSTESTTTGLNFEQNAQTVFYSMDRLILQDNKITYPEFEQALLQYDSNKDGLLSVQETSELMEKLLHLGPSSLSRTIFLVIDVRPTDSHLNRDEYQYMFTLLDTNSDGNIVLDEFMGRINYLHSLFPSTLINSTKLP